MSLLDVSLMGFKSFGDKVRIYNGAKIVGAENISIGSNVIIDDFVFIYATAPIFIGSFVHIASFASITGGGSVVLDDFVTISSGVRLFSGSDDFLGGGLANSTIPADFRSVCRNSLHLRKHVIVGANSVILPGLLLGEGAAVGAGSVVTKSLEKWSIYVGSPARRVRERESSNILKLEKELISSLALLD